jgi:predicted metal-binding protein
MPKERSEKPSDKLTQLEGRLRSYHGPWKGQLVLVCRKCQKKLKHNGTKNKLVKLSKTLKKRARRQESGAEIGTVSVSCLGMCPKGGITVCTGQLLARHECLILRSQDDVDALIEQCAKEQ